MPSPESYSGDKAALYAEIRRVEQLAQAGFKRIDDLRAADASALSAALASSEKAVAKAEISQAAVNEGQNEFRGALRDQASTLMPRIETETLLRALGDRLTLVERVTAGYSSRETGILGTLTAFRAVVLLITSIAAVIVAYLIFVK